MPLDFHSAIELVVQAHSREIDEARLGGSSARTPIPDVHYHSKFVEFPELGNGYSLDTHNLVPSTPKMIGVGLIRPCTPRRSLSPGREPPRTPPRELPRTPSRNELIVEKKSNELIVEKTRSCSFADLPTRSDIQHEKSDQSSIRIASIQSAGSNSNAFRGLPSVEDMIIAQWKSMVEGILLFVRVCHYVVHPGWMENSSPTHTESFTISYSLGARMTTQKKATFVTESQKAALSKLEAKAMKRHHKSHGDSRRKQSSMVGAQSSQILRSSFKKLERLTSFSQTDGCMLHPNSSTRRSWVFCCSVVFLYEMVALTMAPFEIFEDGFAVGLEWFSACFWLSDVFANFISGIYENGIAEMRFPKIARRYIATWFAFDIIVVAAQFLSLLVGNEGVSAIMVLRVFRVVRSLRLGRLFYWLREELSLSVAVLSGGKMLQFICLLYFFIHCFACALYEVGKADDGWISYYEDRLTDHAGHNYLICLHWSLSQLQGNVDLYPGKTYGGLLFVVLSSWCSIVALASFVSSVTDTLSSYREQDSLQKQEYILLSGFFSRHIIDPEIRARTNHFLKLKQKQQAMLDGHEKDKLALLKFPQRLRALLLTEMRGTALTWHPVFSYLFLYHKSQFVKVCSSAIFLHIFEPNDDVFVSGESSVGAYFILAGYFVMNANVESEPEFMTAWIRSNSARKEGGTKRLSDITGSSSEATGPKSQVERSSSQTSRPKVERSTDTSVHGSLGLARFSRVSSAKESDHCFEQHKRPIKRISSGVFVSEISLWMRWMYAGDLCSMDLGQCLRVSTEDLIAALTNHSASFVVMSTYAARFVSAAKAAQTNPSTLTPFVEFLDFHHVLEHEDLQAAQEDPITLFPTM